MRRHLTEARSSPRALSPRPSYGGHIWANPRSIRGLDCGDESAAVAHSLIGSARLNDADPEGYLRHVLERIADYPIKRYLRFYRGTCLSHEPTPSAEGPAHGDGDLNRRTGGWSKRAFRPGVSAAVAVRQYELNANVLFRWRREYLKDQGTSEDAAGLIPVKLVEADTSRSAAKPTDLTPCEPAILELQCSSGPALKG